MVDMVGCCCCVTKRVNVVWSDFIKLYECMRHPSVSSCLANSWPQEGHKKASWPQTDF